MNYIPMQVLEYRFSEAGVTDQIIIAFQHYQGNEQFNARVNLTDEYIKKQNPNLSLDSLTKEQIEAHGRRKLRDWITTPRPEEEVEPEVEE